MKKLTILLFCVTICCSCSPIFVPIVKTYGYYPPSYSAKITTTIPSNAEYIGTIAIVPNDHPVIMGWDKNLLYQTLEKEAAKAGANYVYITNIESSNVDYWFNYEEGDGFSIRAELYR